MKRAKAKKREIRWVIGLMHNGQRARSFGVAHAWEGKKFACGRSLIVKWAGYKRAKIAAMIKCAGYERHCRRCLEVIYPPRPRRTVKR